MRRGLVLLVALAFVAGCGESNPSSPDAADVEAVDLSVDHTVSVDDDGFSPDDLTIAAGDVVRLVNDGSDAHSFTSDDQSFDTGRLEPGDETTLVLTALGEHTYHDVEDPDRTGVITVTPRAP